MEVLNVLDGENREDGSQVSLGAETKARAVTHIMD